MVADKNAILSLLRLAITGPVPLQQTKKIRRWSVRPIYHYMSRSQAVSCDLNLF